MPLPRPPLARRPGPTGQRAPARPWRRGRGPADAAASFALLFWTVLSWGVLGSAPPAIAQRLPAGGDDGVSVFPVGRLELAYADPRDDLPDPAGLLPIEVDLHRSALGWRTPAEGESVETLVFSGSESAPHRLETSGLARMLGAIVARLQDDGIMGVDVRPDPRDIDVQSERDLRPPDRTTLRITIHVGRIQRVRTIAVGDRIRDEWKIDHALHTRIRERSPLQPLGTDRPGTTPIVDRRKLEDYLYELNRHPGRRVEAALAPAVEPGGVVLDYRVLESRPWYLYAQVSDTGTRRTNPWQTRLGAVHRQLTNHDDILSIEYLNAGYDDVNSVQMSYQAPFFGPERPDWMNRRKGDPSWIAWLPREKIPWWGVDRLRWEVDFSYGRFVAGSSSTIEGLANDVVDSEIVRGGGRFLYEALQIHDFFVDAWSGLRLQDVTVENKTGSAARIGNATFIVPRIGLHAERINQVSNLGIDLFAEGSVANNDQDEIENLGRQNADDRYAILFFNFGYSTFLEPLLRPEAWRDPSTESSSTLAHELAFGVHGQYAFDYRLVPQATTSIGGLFSVRGYNQSVAVGDSSVVGSLEYRFHLPRALPVAREPLKLPYVGDFRVTPQQVYGRADWDLTLRAFVDIGRTIRNGSAPAGAPEPDQTLIGAGLGAELQIRSNFRARIDWATALKDTSDSVTRDTNFGDQTFHALFSILY